MKKIVRKLLIIILALIVLVPSFSLTARAEEQEDDGEPFDEKMERLTTELSALFAKSHDLENEIKKNLKAIGFEVE